MAKKRVKALQLSVICGLLSIQLPVFSAQDNGLILTEEAPLQQEVVAAPVATITPTESLAQITGALPADIKPVFSSQLAKIYADRQMKLLWQDETAIEQFQQQLAELALSGVQPQFNEWLAALEHVQLSELGRDVILSDAMLGYLQYLSGVSANGQFWLYRKQPYKIVAPTAEQMKPWLDAAAENRLNEWVKLQAPQHSLYQPMREEMLRQLKMDDDGLALVDTKTLKPGQSSDDVIALREILYRQGLLDETAINTELDAAAPDAEIAKATAQARLYSDELVEAVKKFQQRYGLEADGMVGKGTKVWLNMKPQQKAGLMALNIQRLRIIPENNGTGILVNIPAFSLNFFLNDEVILDSKVIVGRPDRKTPIMSSALNNVVINPPWSVPTSMARKDIAPRGKQDPSYFSRKGYTVYSGWGEDSFEIDPYSINWDVITPANFPYRIRQAPGPTNSLGRYKFNMPSSDAIYLHDTPNHSLFNRSARAISSGCVRVNKASELASILLGDVGWEQKRIDGAVKAGSTRYVNIPDRIPVYLYYQTAWVDKEQQPQYRADIYQYDNSINNAEKYLPAIKNILH
ncbi:L,D-transpeptidase [Providencia stuartii]|uniref:Carboxypeptidase with PGDB-like domain n=1 Tax=Providencia stuartii (strain MRSN 2154) TaxID=1157951 RepID=A0A140NQR7_PROSM|nr:MULTISPECIES: L,D-transpeptidase [Providencia]AFH95251.1 carboxypeptidase with PGDB-like domain [Providencia stuartii MRSN 2154]MDE8745651.1 L,D-transpeptidase [Providencia thailandensis]MDE8764326.1 L,D-transpeptidase [Providencia thailandensis]MDE8776620.1 L,D-transpeptidase [Providencia thailandensis]MDE8780610.1 L,D-transpeptidase [Providencia thailandensis]